MKTMASIRIVSADYYMSYPNCDLDVVYSEFRGTEVRQVPVIQIFGSTQEGTKTCLNIHGVFPYVYIPYDGIENAGTLSYKIASELDKTINISLGQGSSNTCHVHNIILSSGLPIYGYHEKQHQFFKIYFYNPAIIKKACSLLENGSILGKCFQPHESHISYILQFMVDYNLHGMSFINVSQVKYRPNPKYPDQLASIPKDKILPASLQRRSVCELEMDCFACDITNVEEILSGRLGTNPGIAALWEDEKQRRRDKQQDSQISFCLSQERDTVPEPTTTHEFFAQRLVDKLSDRNSDDASSLELDNSVYPAETPDDLDYTITPANVTSFANQSMFEDSLIPDSQNISVFSQTDRNLLEILKELKENVHIEDDSALSQHNPEPEVECSSGDDEEEVTLSLPLNKTINVPGDGDDDDIWNDSFWDENCAFPQLDGTQDINTVNEFNEFMDDLLESGTEAEITSESSASVNQECRYANEVFIVHNSSEISIDQQLNPGVNTLVTTEPQHFVSDKSRVKILSDLLVKPDRNVKVSWHLLTKQTQVQLNIERKDDEFVDPLPFVEDFENDFDDFDEFDMDEIILNDVNFGNFTPNQTDALMDDELSPKTPHAHTNQCSCRQSPCNNSGGNRLFADLFNDKLYDNHLPSSGDKENNATLNTVQKTLNAVKRNLKLDSSSNNKKVEENQGQLLKYNLRSLENTPKHRKCCKLCMDSVGCSKQATKELPEKEASTKVKKPQTKLRKLLNKLESKRKINNNPINTGNRERILVQIPLSRLLEKQQPQQIDVALTASNKLNGQTPELKINEKNNNKVISAENELINIPVKKRESQEEKSVQSSESETTELTTESEELSSISSGTGTEMNKTIKRLNKLELMNWNLDGQNDTPSSDSEHSQKNGIPEKDSVVKTVRTRSSGHHHQKNAPKFRVSGLTKTERTSRNSQQKKKLDKKLSDTVSNCSNRDVNDKAPELLKKDNQIVVNDQFEEVPQQNGSLPSPRLLRNRKIAPEIMNDINVKVLRKRKSQIETNNTNSLNDKPKSNFVAINDEFKENKMENNPDETNNKTVVESNGRLRNKSRYSEVERNLKRQKRLSLSLKHLREKQEVETVEVKELENENEIIKKELRVSLTQMPLDKLTKTNDSTTSKLKDLKIILEPLSPETLERYSTSKTSFIESNSLQHKTKEETEVSLENGNQKTTRNSLIQSDSMVVRRETRSSLKPIEMKTEQTSVAINPTIIENSISETPETENKRKTRQSSSSSTTINHIVENKHVRKQSSNSDSCEEIVEPLDENLIKKLNTTPTKKAKNSCPSPRKYSPLNVIKSPRVAKAVNVENDEPLKKRLRNFDSNLSCEQENLAKKVRISSAIDDDSSRGIVSGKKRTMIMKQKSLRYNH